MAYVIKQKKSGKKIDFLPMEKTLEKNGMRVTLSHFDPDGSDAEAVRLALWDIFRDILEEGQTYPQTEEEVKDIHDFAQYYLAFDVILCRRTEDGKVLGSVYIKPNFPGRSSHICNGGFMVAKEFRSLGICTLLTQSFLPAARLLGYEAAFFNLVYVSNPGAIKVYRQAGFQEIGIVPKAGKLKGIGYTDAIQFYYDLTKDVS